MPYTTDVARAFIEETAPEMHTSGAGLVRPIEVAGRLCGVIDLKKTDWRVGKQRGFVREGVARSAGIVHSGRVDLVVFSKISSDLDEAWQRSTSEPR